MRVWGVPHADIELKPGGKYEIFFSKSVPEGQRGSEGCTILAHAPDVMLAFTWNAPPSIPTLREAGAQTQVVMILNPLSANSVELPL